MGQRLVRAHESPHRQKARSARIFRLLAEGGAVPKLAHHHRRIRPGYFLVDSRNENLPKKRIHQNYAWITVPIRQSVWPGVGTR